MSLGFVIDGTLFRRELYASVFRAQTYAAWLIRCTNAVYMNQFGLQFQIGTLLLYNDTTVMNETLKTDRDTHVVSSYKTFNTRCSDPVIPCSVEQSCASAMCLARKRTQELAEAHASIEQGANLACRNGLATVTESAARAGGIATLQRGRSIR